MQDYQRQQIAGTIFAQLGGRRFIAMTGSKKFMTMADGSLLFDLSRNSSGANRCCITLTPRDTYTVRFYNERLNKKTLDVTIKEIAQHEDVYGDRLQDIFASVTGLYTSLGTIGR
jgi:hypothetical protein